VHESFEFEGKVIRDARCMPIKLRGHSISFTGGHVRVSIEFDLYLRLKGFFEDTALRKTKQEIEKALGKLNFEKFAPVRSQLLCILRAINARRHRAGLELVESSCLRLFRQYPRAEVPASPERELTKAATPRAKVLLLPRLSEERTPSDLHIEHFGAVAEISILGPEGRLIRYSSAGL
jgi:hypothetical protein